MMISQQDYPKYVQKKAKKSPLVKDTALAFLIGGAICALGQVIRGLASDAGLSQSEAATVTTIALVGLSALLTGLNLYNKLARFGGAGTLVPVTGFANAVVSPAIDFRSEGLISGTCVKMFTIAGPVIVWGVSVSTLYGLLLCLLGGA